MYNRVKGKTDFSSMLHYGKNTTYFKSFQVVTTLNAEVGLGARAPGQRRDGAGASQRWRLASDSLGVAGGKTFGSNLNTVRCPL